MGEHYIRGVLWRDVSNLPGEIMAREAPRINARAWLCERTRRWGYRVRYRKDATRERIGHDCPTFANAAFFARNGWKCYPPAEFPAARTVT